MSALDWSAWRPFPDPRKKQYLTAPIGPGVYQVRHRSKKKMVLFGSGKNCGYRMASLLAPKWGAGTRNNSDKRRYVMDHLDDMGYRCMACTSSNEAKKREGSLPDKHGYCFST